MKKFRGFTLVEMAITLVIAAIFIAVAVPSYYSLIQNNKIVSMSNALAASLHYARIEAIRRGARVSVCPAASAALNSCGGIGQWAQGWVVFVDRDSDDVIDPNDELVKVHESLPRGTTVVSNTAIISYDGSGFITSGATNLAISAAGCNRDNARNLALSTTGRLSITRVACP